MSQENIRQYVRDKASINPFRKPPQIHKNQRTDQGRPGSAWGLPQIEWLGIKVEWNCDINQMLSPDSELQPDSQLQRSIITTMSMPWEDILSSKNLDQNSLYANLANLAQITKVLNDYDRSSTIEGWSSQPASQDGDVIPPFSSPRQSQEQNTPTQHIRSSPPSMPASLTPRPQRQSQSTSQGHDPRPLFSSPLSSPPAMIKTPPPYSQQQALRSVSASPSKSPYKIVSKVKEVVDYQDVGHKDDGIQGDPTSQLDSDLPQSPLWYSPEDAFDDNAQGKGKRTPHSPLPSSSTTNRWSTLRRNKNPANHVPEDPSSDVNPDLESDSSSEDLDYHPSSSQAPSEPSSGNVPNIGKAQLQAEHKSEENVKHAARVFLNELNNLFRNRCKDNQKGSPRQWDLVSRTQ
ncbi:MAG: hypothetical protein Q9175_002851 [Cornicularia normoerica]